MDFGGDASIESGGIKDPGFFTWSSRPPQQRVAESGHDQLQYVMISLVPP